MSFSNHASVRQLGNSSESGASVRIAMQETPRSLVYDDLRVRDRRTSSSNIIYLINCPLGYVEPFSQSRPEQ
jgi:hypothetical protein